MVTKSWGCGPTPWYLLHVLLVGIHTCADLCSRSFRRQARFLPKMDASMDPYGLLS